MAVSEILIALALVAASAAGASGDASSSPARPPRALELRVVGPDGGPVAEAAVSALPILSRGRLGRRNPLYDRTDLTGRLTLRPFRPRRPYWVRVEHRLFEALELELEPNLGGVPVTIRLPEPPWALLPLEGRLVGAGHEPIAGAEVEAVPPAEPAFEPWSTTTDADGLFRFARLPEGAYRLTMTAPGYPEQVEPVLLEPGLRPLELRLHRSTLVHGSILGIAHSPGRPYVKAISAREWVEPDGDDPCAITLFCGAPAGLGQQLFGKLTAADAYQLELPPGEWTIQARSFPDLERTGWIANERITVVGGEEEIRVDIEARALGPCRDPERAPRVQLAGQVVDAADGVPVAGARVRYDTARAQTGDDGAFELDLPAEPRGEIEVHPPERWVAARIAPPSDREGWIEIPVEPSAVLCVELAWSDGQPFSDTDNLTLDVRRADGTYIVRGVDYLGPRHCLPGIPAGDLVVEAATRWSTVELPVTAPDPAVRRTLPAAGSLVLRVPELELRYAPGWLDGVSVRLEPLAAAAQAPGTVDRGGSPLRRLGVPPGLWRVTVTADDGGSWTAEAEVRPRTESTVVLR